MTFEEIAAQIIRDLGPMEIPDELQSQEYFCTIRLITGYETEFTVSTHAPFEFLRLMSRIRIDGLTLELKDTAGHYHMVSGHLIAHVELEEENDGEE